MRVVYTESGGGRTKSQELREQVIASVPVHAHLHNNKYVVDLFEKKSCGAMKVSRDLFVQTLVGCNSPGSECLIQHAFLGEESMIRACKCCFQASYPPLSLPSIAKRNKHTVL